jgi:hypothetical protein
MRTFVVRVYRPAQSSPPDGGRLRGVVEEISTGIHATFHNTRELLAILDRSQQQAPGMSSGAAKAPRALPLPDAGFGDLEQASNEGRNNDLA